MNILPYLQRLNLSSCSLTALAETSFKNLTRLTSLDLSNNQLLEAFEVRSGGVKTKQTVTLIAKEVEGSAMTAQAVLSHHSFSTITHPSDCLAKVPFATKRLLKYFLVDNKSLSEDQLDQKSHQTELELGNLEG